MDIKQPFKFIIMPDCSLYNISGYHYIGGEMEVSITG